MSKNINSTALFLMFFIFCAAKCLHSQNGFLYGVNSSDQLVKIDLSQATYSDIVVGTLNVSGVYGLAYDVKTESAYGLTTTGQILSINLNTANTQPIQTLNANGATLFGGFEFVEDTGLPFLYAYNLIGNREVFKVDLSGSVPFTTSVISSGDPIRQITGLAFDSSSQIIYAIDSQQLRIGTVNKNTGVFTPQINNTNVASGNARGLAIDNQGIFYGCNAQPGLVTYNYTSGLGTIIAQTSIGSEMIYVPAPCELRNTGDVINGGFESNDFTGWTTLFKTCKTANCLDNDRKWQTTPPAGHPGAITVDSVNPQNEGLAPFCGNLMAKINDLAGNNHVTKITQQFSLNNVAPTCGYLRFKWATFLQDTGHDRNVRPAFNIELNKKNRNNNNFKNVTRERIIGKNSGSAAFFRMDGYETNLFQHASGDTFRLEMRARDCSEGGHGGTAFLDCLEVVDWCDPVACSSLYGQIASNNVLIPNVFTPNGDGLNDTWQITPYQDFCAVEVEVFNRSGRIAYSNLIANSSNYFQANAAFTLWDGKENQRKKGKKKGRIVPDGVYSYIITVYNCSGSYTLPVGHVTVLDGGICQSVATTATGNDNRVKLLAQASAKIKWRQAVRAAYGNRWDTFSKAKSASVTCTDNGKTGVRKKYTCTATGRPCEN